MEDGNVRPSFLYIIKSWMRELGVFEAEDGEDMIEESHTHDDEEIRRHII